MKKMTIKSWNRCFLCSVPLTKGGEESKPTSSVQQNSSCQRTLFRYLLNEFQGSSALYQDIFTFINNSNEDDLSTNSSSGSSPAIQFCNFCDQFSKTVSDFHTQLEVIQMKIIDKVNAVKQVVINNSRLYGTNQKVKDELEAFEQYLDDQGNVELGSGSDTEVIVRNRKFLQVLHFFQTHVFEQGSSSKRHPLVYLQRYTGTGSNTIISGDIINSSSSSALIKKEANEEEPCFTGEGDNQLEFEFDYGVTLEGSEHDPDWGEGTIKGEGDDEERACSPEPLSSSVRKVTKRKKPHVEKSRPSRSCRSSKRLKKIEAVKKEVKTIAEQLSVKETEAKFVPNLEPLTEAQKIGAEMRLERRKAAVVKLKETYKTLVHVKDEKRQRGKRRKRPRRKKYACEECSFLCDRSFRMEQHLREHETNEKNLKCPDCGKDFSKKQYWDFHIYTYCGSTPWKCDICPETLNWGQLKEHYVQCHEGKAYTCEFCDAYFGTYQTFLDHTVFHPGTRFKCDHYCPPGTEDSSKLYTRINLFRHLHEVHNNTDNTFVCDFPGCSRISYQMSALVAHKQTHEPITHSCNICGKTYSTPQKVEAHIMYAHKKQGPYKCDVCSEIFLQGSTLMAHKRQKHGVEKLKCELCPDKEYTTSRGLKVHMQVTHGVGIKQMFTCQTCGKEVLSAAQLRRHQAVHIEEKNFTCDTCGFACASIERLKKHKLVHDGPKRHACQHCPKIFRLPAHLNEHIRTHTGERPFVCDACGQAFSQHGSLNLHRKKKHIHQEGVSNSTNPSNSSSSTTGSAALEDQEFKLLSN